VLLALFAVFIARVRQALQTSLRNAARGFAPVLAGLALVACSGDAFKEAGPSELSGSVRTLGDADTILVHDQLGSVLAEVNGNGKPTGRFSSYAFGLSRYSTANETRLYAGHARDRGVGLDLMGARFYAPDLGVWTAVDPGLLNSPERGAGADFGAVNAYAYVGLNPVGAKDPNGEFWHIVAGAAIGALIGGGVEAARQYIATGKVEDWGRVGAAAAGGAVAGALTAAVPAAGFAAVMGMGAASGVAGGATTRLVESGGKSAGTLSDVVGDAVVGAATAGLVKGGAAVLGKAAKAVAPKAVRALGRIRALTSEKLFQKQYKLLGQAGRARSVGAMANNDLERIPQAAIETAEHVAQTGSAPPGKVGGRVFANDGRGGGRVLPRVGNDGSAITYREFDVHPRIPGVNRGAERVVVGSDGRSWYTSNHYQSFLQMPK
jgi:RHS repeat-associated protein